MDERGILEQTGLSGKEARAYLALLEAGEATGGAIAQQCNFHRRTSYDVLESLLKKGLASYSVKKYVRFYRAADPKTLLMLLEARKDLLKSVLPGLEKLAGSKDQPIVNVYVGKDGMKTVLNDLLRVRKTFHIYGGAMQIVDALGSFYTRFLSERVRLGIKTRGIMVDTPYVRKVLRETPLFEYKFLPPHVASPASVIWWVYGDRVTLVYWHGEPFVVQVQSRQFSDSFRNYFEHAWSEETSTYKGMEGIKAILEDTLNYKEVWFLGAGGQVPLRFPDYFWKDYVPRAVSKGVKWKAVAWPEVRKMDVVKAPISDFRFFQKGVRDPNVVWIYGEKVVNVLWAQHPIAFMVENKAVNCAYRKYFRKLWGQASP